MATSRHKRWLIGGVIIVVIILAASTWWIKRPQPDNPIGNIVTALAHIDATTRAMQKSWSNTSASSKQHINEYMGYLDDIDADCGIVQHEAARLEQFSDLPATISGVLSNSQRACTDLIRLTTHSRNLYEPIHPLLAINPNLKRYQQLPVIQDTIIKQHTADASNAANVLERSATDSDFESSIPEYLSTLQDQMKKSDKLAYLPALKTFQTQAFTESQQYWTAYGGISKLPKSLQSQIDGYCSEFSAHRLIQSSCSEARASE